MVQGPEGGNNVVFLVEGRQSLLHLSCRWHRYDNRSMDISREVSFVSTLPNSSAGDPTVDPEMEMDGGVSRLTYQARLIHCTSDLGGTRN